MPVWVYLKRLIRRRAGHLKLLTRRMNGKGIVYRFDIRDYWGYTLIDTSASNFTLFYGGSDDDLAFAAKVDLNGKSVSYK